MNCFALSVQIAIDATWDKLPFLCSRLQSVPLVPLHFAMLLGAVGGTAREEARSRP